VREATGLSGSKFLWQEKNVADWQVREQGFDPMSVTTARAEYDKAMVERKELERALAFARERFDLLAEDQGKAPFVGADERSVEYALAEEGLQRAKDELAAHVAKWRE
jgi:hypothetical protein